MARNSKTAPIIPFDSQKGGVVGKTTSIASISSREKPKYDSEGTSSTITGIDDSESDGYPEVERDAVSDPFTKGNKENKRDNFNAFKKVLVKNAKDTKTARIISIASQKGGVGKTATVTNMAVGLVSLGYKTAIIDMDAQGHIAFSFGIKKIGLKKTIYDVLIGEAKMKDIKQNAFGVDLYLSNNSLSDLSPTVTNHLNAKRFPAPKYILKNAIAQIKSLYDFILIDTSPSNDIQTMNSLLASTDIIIPALPEGLSIDGIFDTIVLVKGIQEQGSTINILGILPTMVQDHTNLHNVMLQDLRKQFAETPDIKVFDTVIRRAIRHGLAQTNGEPDINNAPEYLSFVKEVLAIA